MTVVPEPFSPQIHGELSMSTTAVGRGITIGRVMMVIALAAVNLALLRQVTLGDPQVSHDLGPPGDRRLS